MKEEIKDKEILQEKKLWDMVKMKNLSGNEGLSIRKSQKKMFVFYSTCFWLVLLPCWSLLQ